MKTWKQYEARVTVWWNELGIFAKRVSKELRGEGCEDVQLRDFRVALEIKTRKAIAAYLRKWLAQADRNAGPGWIGVVQIHADNTHTDEDIIMMSVKTFAHIVKRYIP